MRTQTYLFEELDSETQDYLRLVRERPRMMPGISVRKGHALPWVGFILGIIGIGVILFATLPPWEDPIRTAFLQMAVILPCGWMIVAAIRVWASNNSPGYLGHFIYADSMNLWDASGSKLSVTGLEGIQEANATVNYNEGAYQNTSIDIKFATGGRKVTVNEEEPSRQLTVYLNALAHMRSPEGGEIGNLAPHLLGGICREIARNGELPQDFSEADVGVKNIPEPQKVGVARFPLLAFLLIPLFAVGGVLLMKWINISLRDDALFEVIVEMGSKPGDLRAYLLDEKNTAHRAEAEKLLASKYIFALQRLQQAEGADPELAPIFREIVQKLTTATQPIVTLRVTEEIKDEVTRNLLATTPAATRIKAVKDKLADLLSRHIGEELIVFAEAPDGVPGYLELSYTLQFRNQAIAAYNIESTISLRTKPDEQPKVTKALTALDNVAQMNDLLPLSQTAVTALAGKGAIVENNIPQPFPNQGFPNFPNQGFPKFNPPKFPGLDVD